MSTTLKRLLKKKQRIYNRAKKYHRKEDWDAYKSLKQQCKGILHQQHKQYVSNLLDSQGNSNNIKCF